MAHFAEVMDDNIVRQVIVIADEHETRGQDYINNELGMPGKWLQCSFNTYQGVHLKQGTPLRMHFPSAGDFYDPELDAFYMAPPFQSWVFNKETWNWDPPVPEPDDINQRWWVEREQKFVTLEEYNHSTDFTPYERRLY